MSISHEQALVVTSALTARDRALLGQGGAMAEPDEQLQALRDASRALHDADVPFALIGGIAVAVRVGVPRATIDIDLAAVTRVPRVAVSNALVAAGFEPRGEFAHSINFRHANGGPVQVAFDAAFDPAVADADADTIDVAGVTVPVVSRDALIAMKLRAAADPSGHRSKALRDRADVELLRGDTAHDDEGW